MWKFPALIVPAIALVLLAACDEEEVSLQEPSATPETLATPEVSPSASSLLPTPTLLPIPADWPTYSDPAGRFEIRYPAGWFAIEGDLFSYDPRLPGTPPGERIKVEVTLDPVAGLTGCGGALGIDRETGEVTIEEGASARTLSGYPAWEMTRLAGSGIEGGHSRIQGISLIHRETCVLVAGYFTQQEPDVPTFLQMVNTFQLKF
jgi:hypothetical protein